MDDKEFEALSQEVGMASMTYMANSMRNVYGLTAAEQAVHHAHYVASEKRLLELRRRLESAAIARSEAADLIDRSRSV